MGRQHPGMDGLDTGRRHEESGETRGMEGAGCQVICGAPMDLEKRERDTLYDQQKRQRGYLKVWEREHT